VRVGVRALAIERDDVLERRDRAVVHVRRREYQAAQRGRLEAPTVGGFARDRETAFLGHAVLHADARVVPALVAEVRAGVAAPAAALALVDPQAGALDVAERGEIAALETIDRAVAAEDARHARRRRARERRLARR